VLWSERDFHGELDRLERGVGGVADHSDGVGAYGVLVRPTHITSIEVRIPRRDGEVLVGPVVAGPFQVIHCGSRVGPFTHGQLWHSIIGVVRVANPDVQGLAGIWHVYGVVDVLVDRHHSRDHVAALDLRQGRRRLVNEVLVGALRGVNCYELIHSLCDA